jgi:EAL domain-containing protein (putative c-di-GMP-specific phosphodiesterase class I)
MHVDELKPDPAFVAPMVNSPQDAVVIRSTVELARSLGITVVAEGVDSHEMVEAVTLSGCAGAQGTLPGEPMSAEVLESWLESLRQSDDRASSRHRPEPSTYQAHGSTGAFAQQGRSHRA